MFAANPSKQQNKKQIKLSNESTCTTYKHVYFLHFLKTTGTNTEVIIPQEPQKS